MSASARNGSADEHGHDLSAGAGEVRPEELRPSVGAELVVTCEGGEKRDAHVSK